MAVDPVVASLLTAVAALSGALAKMHSDAMTREKQHAEKIEELLEERVTATEKAAERLAEASRLAREAQSLLPPRGRY